ncbi:Bypass of stop codon protein [Lachnellula hyalina]|uniref:Bypass of stop codon protein n=1 Tax=Lachnellula hyalina TaxID=1316788 RepID=A0A8H8R2P3_9HELO|nr:Bypass of stop codon protein [Lachnellula hyalina]TVY26956.1 Bypass of stop codon protein [Lachnellula hyalina]
MATHTATLTVDAGAVNPIELQDLSKDDPLHSTQDKDATLENLENTRDEETPPSTAVEARQKWNSPRINMWRVFATFWSFFVMGMNDGSYGALIGRLEDYYDLNYTVVSLVFLSPFAGYTFAAVVNNMVHVRFGQRGIAIVGPACHLVSYIILAVHPPYPVLVVIYIFVGFGQGLVDAAWCAWLGNMANANEVAGFLHSCYALGATVSPLIATGMFSGGGLPWYSFFYVMIGGSAIELLSSATAFWKQTGVVYRTENPSVTSDKSGRTREALKNKVTWIFALFIFGYVGAEGLSIKHPSFSLKLTFIVSLGGWIIQFMTNVRSASSFQSGATSTGFWGGMAVGRVVLGFLTSKLGEFKAVVVYIAISVILELIFWLVPSLIVSAISVALLGFFLGPLFPTAMVFVTKLMPKHLHVGSVGFAAAFGGSGGAIFPFLVGAIAQAKGVKTLQPVILALLGGIAALWLLLRTAGKKKEDDTEEVQIRT